MFPIATRFIGRAFSLKNLDPINDQGGREEKTHSLEGELVEHRSDLDSLEISRRAQKIQCVLYTVHVFAIFWPCVAQNLCRFPLTKWMPHHASVLFLLKKYSKKDQRIGTDFIGET